MKHKKTAGKTRTSLMPPQVGHVLRNFRGSRQLTLEELSRRSGVSKSVLSQIENDQTNPTVTTLWRLAIALGIRIEDLLKVKGKDEDINVIAEHDVPILISPDHRCEVRILGPVDLAGHIEWYDMKFEPNGELVSKPHEPGTIEHLTVLEGKLSVESGRHREQVSLGQTARYRADQTHAIRNSFGNKARAMVVVTSDPIPTGRPRNTRRLSARGNGKGR